MPDFRGLINDPRYLKLPPEEQKAIREYYQQRLKEQKGEQTESVPVEEEGGFASGAMDFVKRSAIPMAAGGLGAVGGALAAPYTAGIVNPYTLGGAASYAGTRLNQYLGLEEPGPVGETISGVTGGRISPETAEAGVSGALGVLPIGPLMKKLPGAAVGIQRAAVREATGLDPSDVTRKVGPNLAETTLSKGSVKTKERLTEQLEKAVSRTKGGHVQFNPEAVGDFLTKNRKDLVRWIGPDDLSQFDKNLKAFSKYSRISSDTGFVSRMVAQGAISGAVGATVGAAAGGGAGAAGGALSAILTIEAISGLLKAPATARLVESAMRHHVPWKFTVGVALQAARGTLTEEEAMGALERAGTKNAPSSQRPR